MVRKTCEGALVELRVESEVELRPHRDRVTDGLVGEASAEPPKVLQSR